MFEVKPSELVKLYILGFLFFVTNSILMFGPIDGLRKFAFFWLFFMVGVIHLTCNDAVTALYNLSLYGPKVNRNFVRIYGFVAFIVGLVGMAVLLYKKLA